MLIRIAIAIILTFVAGFIANEVWEDVTLNYQQQGANFVVNQINTYGEIPVLISGNVTWIPLQTICSGEQNEKTNT